MVAVDRDNGEEAGVLIVCDDDDDDLVGESEFFALIVVDDEHVAGCIWRLEKAPEKQHKEHATRQQMSEETWNRVGMMGMHVQLENRCSTGKQFLLV